MQAPPRVGANGSPWDTAPRYTLGRLDEKMKPALICGLGVVLASISSLAIAGPKGWTPLGPKTYSSTGTGFEAPARQRQTPPPATFGPPPSTYKPRPDPTAPDAGGAFKPFKGTSTYSNRGGIDSYPAPAKPKGYVDFSKRGAF